ncbi:rRNA methyltransferase [Bifidobacterium aemilianum]|uniref:rRNA methyltransferase n=1 Tax=Bifidobacterium aemilianum TaxID=2493120 RepID=A0A366KAN2_9BIFI|nr:RNA methyltransferase [Bifidobacterium aemilianum]RBP98659.1 rRNA methyltransferase [Bifidobacterium aemilianum]
MPMNSDIISNPKSDRVRRLASLTSSRGRRKSGCFLIEGPQSVREAIAYRPDLVSDLYVRSAGPDDLRPASKTLAAIMDQALELGEGSNLYVHMVTDQVMDKISTDSQGIVAVGDAAGIMAFVDDVDLGSAAGQESHQPQADLLEPSRNPAGGTEDTLAGPSVAAFWQVRDPGNAGTVIRAADAAGCRAVVFVDDCVDPLNPKVIRSTAGSLFHLPLLTMTTEDFLSWSSAQGLVTTAADVYGTAGKRPLSLTDLLYSGPGDGQQVPRALLFGNEARGLPQEVLDQVQDIVSIPIYGRAESLNLAASAAVMLFSLAMSSHIERM